MNIHTVASGDTVQQIANKFNVSPLAIAAVNGFNMYEPLVAGMNLLIPAESAPDTYVVKPGDTVSKIAAAQNMSVSQLETINSLDYSYRLRIGQKLSIKGVFETLGYFMMTDENQIDAFLAPLSNALTYLALFSFPISEAGEISGSIAAATLASAKKYNVSLLPVITNLSAGGFSAELGNTVVSIPDIRSKLIGNILTMLNNYDLDGVIVDIEALAPKYRDAFTLFIQDLHTMLKIYDKILVLNMVPKWEDMPDNLIFGFMDYTNLGPNIDVAAIMTYEWGWMSGPPEPTAPLPNVKKVLDYAIKSGIPPNKIYMGLTLYGYDWPTPYIKGNLASSVTLPEAWQLAIGENVTIAFDDTAKQPHMAYTVKVIKHIVYFEDPLSHYHKYGLVNYYGLRGAFYWLVEFPFPATWYMASELFTIKKLSYHSNAII